MVPMPKSIKIIKRFNGLLKRKNNVFNDLYNHKKLIALLFTIEQLINQKCKSAIKNLKFENNISFKQMKYSRTSIIQTSI